MSMKIFSLSIVVTGAAASSTYHDKLTPWSGFSFADENPVENALSGPVRIETDTNGLFVNWYDPESEEEFPVPRAAPSQWTSWRTRGHNDLKRNMEGYGPNAFRHASWMELGRVSVMKLDQSGWWTRHQDVEVTADAASRAQNTGVLEFDLLALEQSSGSLLLEFYLTGSGFSDPLGFVQMEVEDVVGGFVAPDTPAAYSSASVEYDASSEEFSSQGAGEGVNGGQGVNDPDGESVVDNTTSVSNSVEPSWVERNLLLLLTTLGLFVAAVVFVCALHFSGVVWGSEKIISGHVPKDARDPKGDCHVEGTEIAEMLEEGRENYLKKPRNSMISDSGRRKSEGGRRRKRASRGRSSRASSRRARSSRRSQ